MQKEYHRVTPLIIFSIIVLVGSMFIDCAISTVHAKKKQKKEFTSDFRIEDCTFVNTGRNAFFSLTPGDVLTLSDGGTELTITVLDETRLVEFITARGVPLSVTTRVVEELETEDGAVVERSRNFFALCEETGDIVYLGEEVEPAAIGGAWLAGVDGAHPGIIMPGTFLLGSRYYQEIAPDVALDRAEHVAMGLTITVPTVPEQTFTGCVEVVETSALERGKSVKRYCPGIGLVYDDGVELIDYSIN